MPFELIKELTEFSANYRLDKINTLNGDQNSTDKAEQLYWLLRKNGNLTQADAATMIYGEQEEETSNRFQMLKKRLVGRLTNTLFFLDSDNRHITDYRKAYTKAYREYALAKLLGASGQYYGMKYFYRRVFKIAQKFEITDLEFQCAQTLRHLAGSHEKDLKSYQFYNSVFEKSLQVFNAELIAKKYHDEILVNYGASPSSRNKVANITQRAIAELDEQFSFKEKTLAYAFSYYCIKLQGHEATNDIKGMLATADQAISELKCKSFNVRGPITQFSFYKIVANIQAREYGAGLATLQQIKDYLIPASITWFKFQEFAFMLQVHTGEYGEAYGTYLNVTKNKKFKSLSPAMRQIWRLKRAYLYYLQKVGVVDLSHQADPLGKFRLTKFLNSVPEFSNDKKGMNIPVLTLQILFSMLERRYDITVERIEAIEKYTVRHVRRDEHFRSNCFIKALVQFPVAGFHRAAAKRMGEKYITRLKTEIINLSGQSYHVEVVPYDVLWPIALSSMEEKRWEAGAR